MNYIIENDYLRVTVRSLGAEVIIASPTLPVPANQIPKA